MARDTSRPRRRSAGSCDKVGGKTDAEREGRTATGPDAPPAPGDRLLLDLLAGTHTVQTSSGPVEMTLREALLRKALETAMKGSPIAQRDLLDRDARASAEDAARIAADCADWSDFRDFQQRRHDAARAAGRPTADLLPHPDDIEIVPGRGVRFRGPFTPEERKRWDGALALREALFLQDALEHTLNGRKETPPAAGTPLSLAFFLDMHLPPSLRMPQHRAILLMSRLHSTSKRDLLRDTHRAWARAGVPLRRGARFPPPHLMWEFFDILFTGVHDILAAKTPAEEDAIAEDVAADLNDCRREAKDLVAAGSGKAA